MKSQKGQATVEMALSITVLMLVLFGVIDFGRIFFAYINLEHTGKEIGRTISLSGTDSEAKEVLTKTSSLNVNKVTLTVSPGSAGRKQGVYATVNQSYQLELMTPFVSKVIPNPITIKNKTVVRVE